MNWLEHSDLKDKHAFLGASKYSWVRYDDEKLKSTYLKHLATLKGTELHDFACRCIQLGIKVESNFETLNMYVNDAIDYDMQPEQPLWFSENCFGTADAISFKDNSLRIHDLKTGTSRTSFDQLCVYAALFCLEYEYEPYTIDIELRIYKNNSFEVVKPEPEYIANIMYKIIRFDALIDDLKEGN